jgi:RNA polymerase sigma-70 factor (ECF subfamily)
MADSAQTRDARRSHFDALFDENFAAVRAYVVRRGDAAIVDDVLSETFLAVWRRIDDVPDDALPWLLGIARRMLANQRRAAGRRAALVEVLGSVLSRADAVEPAAERFGPLADAIATLSRREREAVLLVAWEGLDPARAARVVGCEPATFRARLYRGRRRLATLLGEPPGRQLSSQPAEEAR